MKHDSGLPTWSSRTILLVALPCLVMVFSLMVWITAVSRSGFWADDFLNVTHFYRSLGDLSNDEINAGRYVTNIFWALGTYTFGSASVVPFLLLNSLVFTTGLVLWLRTGTKTRWRTIDAWWIGGLFIATSVWYQTALSASAIGHSCGFLALGLGLWSHERCMRSQSLHSSMLWSLVGGAAWTIAVLSNIIYLGLMPIAAYCAVHQVLKLRQLGADTKKVGFAAGFWNIALPVLYFATVAYPATTSKAVYAHNGLTFVHPNLRFYRAELAPTTVLVIIYFAVILAAIARGVVAARRKDWFPMALVLAAGATVFPALIQSHQRGIYYLAMPMLLTFSALAAGLRPVLVPRSSDYLGRLRGALFLAATVTLALVFGQGANVRSYFVATPFGRSLATFRSEVASLTPESGAICANLHLNPQQQALLIADMSGPDGFYVPPISAAQAYLLSAGQKCPAQGSAATTITVSVDARGDFVAAR